jgi:predicted DNA-binding transcriptional regulator AlpA
MTKAVNATANRDRLVTRAEALRMFGGISLPTLYRLIKAGRFPAPIQIAQNRVGFLQSEIDAHMQRLASERDARRRTEAE